MLLAVDIGNSAIKFGVFDSVSLVRKTSIRTPGVRSSDPELSEHLDLLHKQYPSIEASLICSVVPEVNEILSGSIRKVLDIAADFVEHNFDFGIDTAYHPKTSLGIDRLLNSSAAAVKYGVPVIACSFGTATTIDVVDQTGTHLGGTIAPGLGLLADALHNHTAKLPLVTIERTENIIGTNTTASIQSGVFHGHVGGVESMIRQIRIQIGGDPRVIATGGFAKMIAGASRLIDVVEENLTLEGLHMLHNRGNH